MLGKYINHCEDSLTASVFSHLLHLPTEIWWGILRAAAYTDQLPVHPGEPEKIDFWPKWDSERTTNSRYVEPDLFFRFKSLDLIIEAKRWDKEMQNSVQWRNQVTAYANEYRGDGEKRELRMIALGGLWSSIDAQVTVREITVPEGEEQDPEIISISCPVHKCLWRSLLDECLRLRRDILLSRYSSSETLAHQRILSDVIDLFAWHGYQTGVWYRDVVSKVLRLGGGSEDDRARFRSISRRLSKV